jgi:hypothetical protein
MANQLDHRTHLGANKLTPMVRAGGKVSNTKEIQVTGFSLEPESKIPAAAIAAAVHNPVQQVVIPQNTHLHNSAPPSPVQTKISSHQWPMVSSTNQSGQGGIGTVKTQLSAHLKIPNHRTSTVAS